MSEIKKLEALEILDSRGNPTLAVTVTLNYGVKARSKIPSGASTGQREAVELRDHDKTRYGGKGILKACGYVEGEIQNAVQGMDPNKQEALDHRLCSLDGTPNQAVADPTQLQADLSLLKNWSLQNSICLTDTFA